MGRRDCPHRQCQMAVCRRVWCRLGRPCPDEDARHHDQPRRSSRRQHHLRVDHRRDECSDEDDSTQPPMRQLQDRNVCRIWRIAHTARCQLFPDQQYRRLGHIHQQCESQQTAERLTEHRRHHHRKDRWHLPGSLRGQRPHADLQSYEHRWQPGTVCQNGQCHRSQPARGGNHHQFWSGQRRSGGDTGCPHRGGELPRVRRLQFHEER